MQFPIGQIFAVLFVIQATKPQADPAAEVRRLIDSRELPRAEDLTVSQIASAGRTPKWILFLAEIRLDQQRNNESLQLLDGARQLGDFSAQNRLLAALNYVALSRMDLAEPEFRAALQQDATNPRTYYYLGRLLYTKNSFDEAIEKTSKALELDPGMVRAYDNLGLCYEALQRYKEAEKAYLSGIQRQRQSGERIEWPSLNLGVMLVNAGDRATAKAYFEEALRINPRSGEAHFRLGSVLEHEEDLDGALEQYRQAAACDPKLAKAYYRSGIIYRGQGKEKEARQQFLSFEQYSGKK